MPIRLYRAPDSPEFETQQIRDWYASLDYAVREEIWPEGQAEALANMRPFLALLADSCDEYLRRSGNSLQACEINEHRYERAPVSPPPMPLLSNLPGKPGNKSAQQAPPGK